MERLFLVDAYALIYRCYYAFMGRPMRNAEGLNTSAIFGFVKFLRDIIRKEHPHHLGVAFDTKGETFRHKLYPEYKANRQETPEDIHLSVPYIKKILKAMRIPVLEKQGWEADDIIGTLSCKAEAHGWEVYMVTPDKDFGQLVKPNVYIYKQRKGGEGVEVIGMPQIKEYYGVDDPKLIVDILALWGDASDNIPGVPGIGEKTAIKFVCEYGPVENLLANIDKLKGKQRDNIEASREQLPLSKVLATIDVDAPIDFVPEDLLMEQPNEQELRQVYHEMGFNMFIREMDAGIHSIHPSLENERSRITQADAGQNIQVDPPKATKTKPNSSFDGQGSLFGNDSGFMPQANVDELTVQQNLFDESNYENISTVDHDYQVVRDGESLKKLVELLSAQKEFCFDTETSGFDVFNDRLVGISFSYEPYKAWYVPFDKTNAETNINILRPLFENAQIAKIGQNIKFDIMVLANAGISVRGFKYDTMILHYLIDPDSRHNMTYLSRTYLGYSPVEIETLIGKGVKQITMDMVSVDRVAEYAAEDADVTLRLKEVLWDNIKKEGLADLYSRIEEPMIDVLADIELTGVKIDTGILAESGKELNKQLVLLENKIRQIAAEPMLNVNSAKQLGETLFAKMKIDPNPKMTKTKQYRTDEEYLQSLSDKSPIIGLILEYRGTKKLLSTYIEALPHLVNPKTGRVHTSYNQAVASTGRLSSSNPNLQNIPVRDEQGREIRKAFVPSDDEHLLFSADYSQVELRLMAHLSEDKNLLEAFRNKEDVHTATASLLFNVPLSDVTADQRRKAKTANFGIIYGISAFGLSQRLNIPRSEAKDIIDGYFRSYPGVKTYMDKVIEQAREQGYVSTIFGRKRYLKDINSRNANVRGLSERNAINAPIQGSAADIMKIAIIDAHKQFQSKGMRSKVIMQVHDELVVDMYKPEEESVRNIVVSAMEGAAKLLIELTVDYSTGRNWVEAH